MSQQTDTYPQYGTPVPPAPRPRSAGRIIGIVAGAVAGLAGIGTAAVVLFGPGSIDEAKVTGEIVRITHDEFGVDPADVRCPADVVVKTGTVFTCGATLDGQPITYTVTLTDDEGTARIESGEAIKVAVVEAEVARQVSTTYDVAATASCAEGRTIVVGGEGTAIRCTATSTSDPTDTLEVTATLDAQGGVTVTE